MGKIKPQFVIIIFVVSYRFRVVPPQFVCFTLGLTPYKLRRETTYISTLGISRACLSVNRPIRHLRAMFL
jgi:hypothetical protein